ncbi:MAG: ribonuclease Y [Candidatus Woykebacteria bacterium RBG_13_40_7b]|uniref:Ribonuclease Y n=1 Tax=Candidatus Woykebacteria bacterium RBG_13_40_7b TaxID=1802594 RepID=A0A1G1W8Q1_9BACT|nr:MAG: ribonuclease Y [Candidatus Woykebacteria bacterium RBG_13_40_7b]
MAQFIVVGIAALVIGAVASSALNYFLKQRSKPQGKEPEEESAKEKESSTPLETKAKEIILEARDEAYRIKKAADEEARSTRSQVFRLEQRVAQREEEVDKKLSLISEKENQVAAKERSYATKTEEIEKTRGDLVTKLEKVAGITRDEAKKLILEATEVHLKDEVARRIRESEDQIKQGADQKAKEILVEAMQRGATDYVAEFTTSVVKLADPEMKGRIIGREGRNIRAFEAATGCDVEMDAEEPNEIRLSSFDGERREIARVSLEKLIADGRIQPSRIEEIVDRVKGDFEKIRREWGEKILAEVGIHGLPPELVETLGRFKWRYSYGQNLWQHTLEETKIGVGIAKELGLDINKVKLGCLFHDIGKVFTPEAEGTHVQVGADYLRKFNLPQDVVSIIEEHHEDKPFSSLESTVVWISDAISGSRPGARHEVVEEYMKRLKDLENIASSFQGVEKSFAIAAGREVRVVVVPQDVDDSRVTKLSHDIAEKIHDSLTYPGQVKVVVVRETRSESIAK